jgi:hypothetical protein
VLLSSAFGWAQDARPGADPEQPEPWIIDESIPIEQRERARELFHQGTRYLKDGFFDDAAQTYEQALELFDHPGIRYNLAVAQINLKQPIEAYRNILAAMRYGDVPIDREIYEQARNYRALLETQLAHIEIHCHVPGAEVTLDGQRLFIAPGQHRGIVVAGAHQVVAVKDGHIPETRQLVLEPGRVHRVTLAPRPIEQIMTRTERRWAAWKPWAVAGASATLLAAGVYLDRSSTAEFQRYNDMYSAACPEGCYPDEIPGTAHQQEQRAQARQRYARASYAVGGAVLATGLILAYLNRERVISMTDATRSSTVSITPVLTSWYTGAGALWRF